MKIYLDTWLYNAGIVGLVNVLSFAGHKIRKKENYIEFDDDCLDNFEEKYFKFLIYKHNDDLTCSKVIEQIAYLGSGYSATDDIDEYVEKMNSVIGYVKKKISSASYKSAFDLAHVSEQAAEYLKKLEVIKFSKKTTPEEKIITAETALMHLDKVKVFLENENVSRYVKAKNVIYDVIVQFWNDISFLNNKCSGKDMYMMMDDDFLKPIRSISTINKKEKVHCSICDTLIPKDKKYLNSLSFLNNIGVDGRKKSSHYWNFDVDCFVCPLCKLVFICIPAGFNYSIKLERGHFINQNISALELLRANNQSSIETLSFLTESYGNSMEDRLLKKEIDNIQVINYVVKRNVYSNKVEQASYEFSILNKRQIEILIKYRGLLDTLAKKPLLLNSSIGEEYYCNIYLKVMSAIYDNRNIYALLNDLLRQSKKVNIVIFKQLLLLNSEIINKKEASYMGSFKTINEFISQGQSVRHILLSSGSERKLNSLTYKILNQLKTKNPQEFLHIFMNLYAGIDRPVPLSLSSCLTNEDDFLTYGYSFLIGLNGESSSKDLEKVSN